MDTQQKLAALADASRFDLSCACGTRTNDDHRRRGSDGVWLYPASLPAGGASVMLKTLLSNVCVNDCRYCPFRRDRDTPRYTLGPEEVARAFMDYVDHLGLDGIRCETVHAACWLGALVHDMGYLDQYHREVGHEVAAVLPYHPGVPDVSEERLDELLRGTLVKRYLEMVVPGFPTAARGAQLIQRWLRSTHSASSTLMLLGHLKAAPLAYQSEPELQLMVNLAALAALKHDFPEKVPPARIVRVAWSGPTEPWVADPVSYLLMLADQIQEFNRARLEWTPKLRRVVPCPKARLRSRTESPAGQRVLNIRFEFASGHEGSRDHARETLERVYGEPQQDSGWSALDSVLGRLEFDVR